METCSDKAMDGPGSSMKRALEAEASVARASRKAPPRYQGNPPAYQEPQEDEFVEVPSEWTHVELDDAPSCENCETTDATLYCDHCRCQLCAHCSSSVHQPKALRRHTLRPVTERQPMCPTHDEPINLVCLKCRVAVCSLCFSIGTHRQHQAVKLETASLNSRIKLQHKLARTDELATHCMRLQSSSDRSRKLGMAKDEIGRHFEQLRSVLQKQEQQLLEELDQQVDQSETEYNQGVLAAIGADIEHARRNAADLVLVSSTAVSSTRSECCVQGSDTEVVAGLQECLDKLDRLEEIEMSQYELDAQPLVSIEPTSVIQFETQLQASVFVNEGSVAIRSPECATSRGEIEQLTHRAEHAEAALRYALLCPESCLLSQVHRFTLAREAATPVKATWRIPRTKCRA